MEYTRPTIAPSKAIRVISGNKKVVRLFFCGAFLDLKWFPADDPIKHGSYLIVVSDLENEKYLIVPSDTNPNIKWDQETYQELNEVAPVPEDQNNQDPKKHDKGLAASELFRQKSLSHQWFNDLKEANRIYMRLAFRLCGQIVDNKI